MDSRIWKIITLFLGGLFLISFIFLIVFGLRLNKANQIKAKELSVALTKQDSELKKSFQLERERTTTKYVAEDLFGAFEFSYPKVWFTNMQRSDSDPELQFLADPSLIVMRDDKGPETALRVIISKDKFDEETKKIENEAKSRGYNVSAEDITLSGLKGKKFTGKMKEDNPKTQSIVVLPLRDKSLTIGTDDFDQFNKQFDSIIKSFKISR